MKNRKIWLFSLLIIMFAAFAMPATAQAATKVAAPVITVKTSDGNPKISWKAVENAAGYRVYRKTAADEVWVKVANTTKTSYTDKKWDAANGSNIKYRVKAYVKKGTKVTWSEPSASKKWKVTLKKKSSEDIYRDCVDGVVVVYAYTNAAGTSWAQGSGFFIDDYTIVTNYHVIEDGVNFEITMSDDSKCNVEQILGFDADLDIAILKVDKKGKALKRNTHGINIGEVVYALGNPQGLYWTFLDGMVSAIRKDGKQDIIQINADITHGSSGGALLNAYGEVMGITSSGLEVAGLNFAINIDQIDLVNTDNPYTVDGYVNRNSFPAVNYVMSADNYQEVRDRIKYITTNYGYVSKTGDNVCALDVTNAITLYLRYDPNANLAEYIVYQDFFNGTDEYFKLVFDSKYKPYFEYEGNDNFRPRFSFDAISELDFATFTRDTESITIDYIDGPYEKTNESLIKIGTSRLKGILDFLPTFNDYFGLNMTPYNLGFINFK